MKSICLILAIFILITVFCTDPVLGEERFFEIRAKKFEYKPSVITVNKGDTVKIRLVSEDVHHGFYVDGYEVKTSAYMGKDGHLTFVADKAGRFTFRCSVTCGEFHPYMVGYLVVAPNNRSNFYLVILLVAGFVYLISVITTKVRPVVAGGKKEAEK